MLVLNLTALVSSSQHLMIIAVSNAGLETAFNKQTNHPVIVVLLILGSWDRFWFASSICDMSLYPLCCRSYDVCRSQLLTMVLSVAYLGTQKGTLSWLLRL